MYDEFWAWYQPSSADYEAFSKQSTVAVDANVLLAPYRVSATSRDTLLDTLESLKDRLFVPRQAALEYQRNRLGVVAEQTSLVQAVQKDLADVPEQVRNLLEPRQRKIERHPTLDWAILQGWIAEAVDRVRAQVEEALKNLTIPSEAVACADDIHTRLTALLDGRVGIRLSDADLEAISDEGPERYKRGIPPGFADKSKKDDKQFGDLIIWKELIAKAKSSAMPLVFVTDDQKEDWIRKDGGLRAGPLPALREEFHAESGQHFWLYTIDQFLRMARNFTAAEVDETVIKEVVEHVTGDAAGQREQAIRDELRGREAVIASLHASVLTLTQEIEQGDTGTSDAIRHLRARLDREIDRAAELKSLLRGLSR